MFWFVFISIILFIVFLIVLLFSSQSTSDNTAKRLKDELVTKNKIREEKLPVSKKAEPNAKTAPIQRQEPKIEERVVAAAAVEEIQAVEAKAPSAVEVIPDIEESIKAEEKAAEAVEESVSETLTEVEEYAILQTEEEIPADEEASIIEEVSAQSTEEVVTEAEETLPTKADFAEEAVKEETVSEEVEVTAEEEAYDYLPFDNTRAMEEFGLPKEDADLFIVDLINQIEEEMPALQVAVEARDNKKIEDISHMIKGSATNLGTGGAADVLVDFNTYMKTGDDPVVIAAHMRNLNRALADLKEQFQ